jgi:putative transposase
MGPCRLPGCWRKTGWQRTPPAGKTPELVATAPGEVFTGDISKLAGPVKGKYFDCYMMFDIHSRFIVGANVHPTESGSLAAEMMKLIFGIHGIPQVVHADRGTSMTSKTEEARSWWTKSASATVFTASK